MSVVTFAHQFEIGDSVFVSAIGLAEIVYIEYNVNKTSNFIRYTIKDVFGKEFGVLESGLTAVGSNTSAAQPTTPPPTQSSGVYTPAIIYHGNLNTNSPNTLIPNTLTFNGISLLDPEKAECECGAEAVGSSSHSSWCDKAHSLTDLGV